MFNKTVILGRLMRDPQLKEVGEYTVSNCIIISEDRYSKRKLIINIAVWGRSANLFSELCNKGDLVLVEGQLKQEETDDHKVYTSLIVSHFHKVSSPRGSQEKSNENRPQQEENIVVDDKPFDDFDFPEV